MASVPVTAATLERVRANFVAKRHIIVSHSKPWLPWALANLLEIDDKNTAWPAEKILYTALKASRPNRIGLADPVVQVNIICLFPMHLLIFFVCFRFHRKFSFPKGKLVNFCSAQTPGIILECTRVTLWSMKVQEEATCHQNKCGNLPKKQYLITTWAQSERT